MIQSLEHPPILMRLAVRGRTGHERGMSALKLGKENTDPTNGCGDFILRMIDSHRAAVQSNVPNWAGEVASGLARAVENDHAQGSVSAKDAYQAFVAAEKAIQRLGK